MGRPRSGRSLRGAEERVGLPAPGLPVGEARALGARERVLHEWKRARREELARAHGGAEPQQPRPLASERILGHARAFL